MTTQINKIDPRLFKKLIQHKDELLNLNLRIHSMNDVLSNLYSREKNDFIVILTNNNLNINYFNIVEKKNTYLLTILHLKYSFKPLFIMCLDYFIYNNVNISISTLNLASFFNPIRLNINIKHTKFFLLPSLSNIFYNSVWLEREILDFSQFTIYNLKDTRRLLLDYLQKRQHPHSTFCYNYTYNNYLNDLYTI